VPCEDQAFRTHRRTTSVCVQRAPVVVRRVRRNSFPGPATRARGFLGAERLGTESRRTAVAPDPTMAPLATHPVDEFVADLDDGVLSVRIRQVLGGYVCERSLEQRDGSTHTQVFPFDALEALKGYFLSDPCYSAFRASASHAMRLVESDMRRHEGRTQLPGGDLQRDSSRPIESLDAADGATCAIQGCRNEVDLVRSLRRLVRFFGMEAFVFLGRDRDSAQREHFRYLIGCPATWCQLYVERKWFMIDPYLHYAMRNSAPILRSTVIPESRGQAEMLSAAAVNGFKSGIALPTHNGSASRLGLLVLGSSRPSTETDAQTIAARNHLRAIAMETFEWWDARLYTELVGSGRLDKVDLIVLEMERDGRTAEDIADALGLTESSVHNRFRKINAKLGVHRKRDAVLRAIEIGALKAA